MIARAALRAALVMGYRSRALDLPLRLRGRGGDGMTDLAIWLLLGSAGFVVLLVIGLAGDAWDARERRARSKDGPRWR